MKKTFILILTLIFNCSLPKDVQSQIKTEALQSGIPDLLPIRISLNGESAFAADYADAGEEFEWFSPDYKDDIWDRVQIPHVWSLDPRYPFYEGIAWYRKSFTAPSELKDKHIRLVFEAVYANSVIWLNGEKITTHHGGYTPFEVDVTSHLYFDKPNLLVVKAENFITKKPRGTPQLVRAWMEDGGIIRDVYLEATADVYVTNQKIHAEPDFDTGEATIHVATWVRNTRSNPATINLNWAFKKENELLRLRTPKMKVEIQPGSTELVEYVVNLPKEMVGLWGLDSPVLYSLTTSIDGIGTANPVIFGIRKFEARGTQLFLNGFPVRLAGGNRVASGTGFGQNDPVEFVEKDMRLMKEAGMEFMRMHHVPLSRAVLDWADRNGLLLIQECETPTDLFSEEATKLDRMKMREMITRDWNRPSIVAWSIGNEYESETPEGVKWSMKMKDFVLSVDSTRLICFASNRAANPTVNPEQEASTFMDFVCLNTYGAIPDDNAANIDRAHQRWPDKPLIITEYGYRADRVGQEQDRELWFEEMFKIFRDRPFVSGASIWSFNDYRSRYVSTNPDGYRWWGLVDADRNIRGTYLLFKREFTPIVLQEARMNNSKVVVKLSGRTGFPVYPPTGGQVNIKSYNFRGREIDSQTRKIEALGPGDVIEIEFPLKEGVSYFRGEIFRGDFSMMIFGPTTWSKIK
jgi:beta-glucuronidase